MSTKPTIGQLYISREVGAPHIYVIVGDCPDYLRQGVYYNAMVLLGGGGFEMAHESDYARLRATDREPILQHIQKHAGGLAPLSQEFIELLHPANVFASDPTEIGTTLIQSKKQLQAMLEIHFMAHYSGEWDIILDFYDKLNHFERLHNPRLSL